MTTKTARRTTHQQDEDANSPLEVAAQARQQLALVNSAASMMYRATESIQKVQQQWIQRAALRHHQFSERLQAATSAADVLAVQSTMMTSALQEAGLYWQDLVTAGLQVHSTMTEMTESSPTQHVFTSPAVNPVMQAWQTMFTAPLNGALNPAATHH